MARDIAQGSSNFGFLTEHSPLLADLGRHRGAAVPVRPCQLRAQASPAGRGHHAGHRGPPGLRCIDPARPSCCAPSTSAWAWTPQVRQLFHLLRRTGNRPPTRPITASATAKASRRSRSRGDRRLVPPQLRPQTQTSSPAPSVLPDDPSQRLLAAAAADCRAGHATADRPDQPRPARPR